MRHIFLMLAFFISFHGVAFGDGTAKSIMKKVYDRDSGDKVHQTIEMTLIDKSNKSRKRVIDSRMKKFTGIDKSVMVFTAPSKIRGTSFLNFDNVDSREEDNQWVYLPSLKKSKKISTGNKKKSFFGSDFTYADLSKRNLEDYKYELLGEESIQGNKVWVIRAVPNAVESKLTGYNEMTLYIRKDNYFVVKSVNQTTKKGVEKVLEVQKLSKIMGVWVPEISKMVTKSNGRVIHSTVMKVMKFKNNSQVVTADLFNVERLGK